MMPTTIATIPDTIKTLPVESKQFYVPDFFYNSWKISKYMLDRIFWGFFPTNDMQAPSPLRSGNICMKDAHSAESNEKSIFRFLFFELWLIVFTIYGESPGCSCVSPTKKKSFIGCQIYWKDAQ